MEFSLGPALVAAAACEVMRVVELLRLVEAKTNFMLLQCDSADTALKMEVGMSLLQRF